MIPNPKATLRIEYLARRQALSAETLAACGEAVAAQLLPLLDANSIVAGYAAIKNEVPLMPLMRILVKKGIRLALPCVTDASKPLVFRRWVPQDDLARGPYGTQQPMPHAEIVTPDTVLVPLLVFDRSGHRLGFGAGYYDRTLDALREQHVLKSAIGIAHSVQEHRKIPSEAHDEKLDMIVTEKEVIRIASAKA